MKEETYIKVESRSNYKLVRIKDFADIIMGQSPPSETYNTDKKGLPFFQGKAEFGKIHPTVQKWCTFPHKIAEPNDILVSVRAPVGAVNIAEKLCGIGRGLAAIRYLHCPLFLFYYFKLIEKKLDEEGTGTTFKAISADVIRENTIFLPPLAEQHRIVAKIEELFSALDKGIESLKTAQQQLKVYRQAVLKYAFEGIFTAKWRLENPNESALIELKRVAEHRSKNKPDKKSIYNKKLSHEFEFSNHDQIKTWAKGTLDKLVYIAARIGWRGLKKNEYTSEGPLFLSVHSLNHGKYVDYSKAFHVSLERYNESPEIQLEEGDVLLCKDGAGIGKIGIVKNLPEFATVNSSLLVIRGMEVLSQEFLFYLFSGPVLQKLFLKELLAVQHLTYFKMILINLNC